MTKVTLTQFSFNRGELDPALHGRSDWKYYYSGAEKLQNILTRPQGGAVKRGGLRLIARALDDERPSHFIPFRFSVRQSYLLEFGDRRMRVIKDGGVVLYPEGHEKAGQEVIVETPYAIDDLSRLRHAQTADVMILAHADYPPRRLSRRDHHDWRLERLLIGERTATPEGVRAVVSGGDGSRYVVTAHSTDGGESAPSEKATATNTEVLEAPDSTVAFSVLYAWLKGRDSSYIPAEIAFYGMGPFVLIDYLIGCGYQDRGRRVSGSEYRWHHIKPGKSAESILYWWDGAYSQLIQECLSACDLGYAGNVKTSLQGAVQKYVDDFNAGLVSTGVTSLEWEAVAGADGYRIYRNRSEEGEGAFRRIGDATGTAFTDDNLPDLSAGLPEDPDLFDGVDDYPGACAFFEQRLILARTNNKPTTFWGSETGVYNSFIKHSPIEDTDCYEFSLASGEMNEIHWIVPLNDMLLGTSGGEWKAGGGGSAITPSNINARIQSWYGCSHLRPVVVGRTVIFTGRGGRSIRNFTYSLEADGYAGRDLTAYAGHLFAGRSITGMCYQQNPYGILWVVMSDGALLSCTYAPEEDVMSWSRHQTAGHFESCASLVGTDGTDSVYFCVKREVNGVVRRFIETLEAASDAVATESEGFFLDCGLTYRGAPANKVSGLDHLEGEAVSCLADGSVFADLVVREGCLTLPDGFTASEIHAGLPYRTELITLELEPEDKESLRNRSRFVVAAVVRFLSSRECLYGHSDGMLSEMKFRAAELPGQAAPLFTGEKNIIFTSPPGTRTTRLRFVSETPTPFTILGVIAEASCGQPA